MFNPVQPTPTSPKDAFFGILIAMVTCYVLYSIPNFLRGDFSIDLEVVRFLLSVALFMVGFAWWEARRE